MRYRIGRPELLVTLDKSEGYPDRIAYRDYAISAERFHWQSQNSAGPDTAAGRRYLRALLTAGCSSSLCEEKADPLHTLHVGQFTLRRFRGSDR